MSNNELTNEELEQEQVEQSETPVLELTEDQKQEAIDSTVKSIENYIDNQFQKEWGSIPNDAAKNISKETEFKINELIRLFLIEKLNLEATTDIIKCFEELNKTQYIFINKFIKNSLGNFTISLALATKAIEENYEFSIITNVEFKNV